MYSISFCTAIRNRLHHLKETLPKNVADNEAYPFLEFVILDYNSNDGLEDWMKVEMAGHLSSGRVVYRRLPQPEYFHRSHSRNMAFGTAKNSLVCNIDADNFTGKGFAAYIDQMFRQDSRIFLSAFSSTGPNKPDFFGRICCKKTDFDSVGGYNELIAGYGFEDYELVGKLRSAGLKETFIEDHRFFSAIPHDDLERIAEEKTFKLLNGLFLSFINPHKTDLLFLFNDGTFSQGALVDQTTLNACSYKLALEPPVFDYEFTLESTSWNTGCWEKNSHGISLTSGGTTRQFKGDAAGKIIFDGRIFRKTNDSKLITNLVLFYTQFTNRAYLLKQPPLAFHRTTVSTIAGVPDHTVAACIRQPLQQYRKLRTSIFYDKKVWHVVLKELIIPLSTKVKDIAGETFYIVHLSDYRGQHLGITWFLPIEKAADLVEKIAEEVNAFLKMRPSAGDTGLVSAHTTFKNFEVNTLAFNLYPYPYFTASHLNENDFLFISTNITGIINHTLTDDGADIETTFTLACYLHVLLFRGFSQAAPASGGAIIQHLSAKVYAAATNHQAIFTTNAALFQEIITDLYNDVYLNEPGNEWMLSWLHSCHQIIEKKNADSSSLTTIAVLFEEVSMLILEHLSLDHHVQKILIGFIRETLTPGAIIHE